VFCGGRRATIVADEDAGGIVASMTDGFLGKKATSFQSARGSERTLQQGGSGGFLHSSNSKCMTSLADQ